MWSKLRSLFRPQPTMLDDDEPPTDREEFLRYLQTNGVLLVASELDDSGMTLVVQKCADGREVNPLFSTAGSVRRWIEKQQLTGVTPFPSLRMKADWLVKMGMRGEPKILFDPESPWERDVTAADLELLESYLAESKGAAQR